MLRREKLKIGNFSIYQDTDHFLYGTDAVVLSDFIKCKKNDTLIEFGSGSLIIPILLYAKGKKFKKIYSLEVQKEVYNIALMNRDINNLTDKIEILNADLKDSLKIFGSEFADIVFTNPPYRKVNTGTINPNINKAIARHEIMCTIEDVIKSAMQILKFGGSFYMVYRSDRLTDAIYYLRMYKLEPKQIRFVHQNKEKESSLVLIEAKKGKQCTLKIDKPLFIDEMGYYLDSEDE
ncbi:tRNA1(Val) (adenine(37)-N6)-methyltransferase [Caldicellulosiruptoraceae bacterium PP1]